MQQANASASSERAKLIETWLSMVEAQLAKRPFEDKFWAYEQVLELSVKDPWKAWEIILELIDKAPTFLIREIAAVGPLEYLLVGHGEVLIDAFEEEASRNEKLKSVIGRMMLEGDTPVWKRIYIAGGEDPDEFNGTA